MVLLVACMQATVLPVQALCVARNHLAAAGELASRAVHALMRCLSLNPSLVTLSVADNDCGDATVLGIHHCCCRERGVAPSLPPVDIQRVHCAFFAATAEDTTRRVRSGSADRGSRPESRASSARSGGRSASPTSRMRPTSGASIRGTRSRPPDSLPTRTASVSSATATKQALNRMSKSQRVAPSRSDSASARAQAQVSRGKTSVSSSRRHREEVFHSPTSSSRSLRPESPLPNVHGKPGGLHSAELPVPRGDALRLAPASSAQSDKRPGLQALKRAGKAQSIVLSTGSRLPVISQSSALPPVSRAASRGAKASVPTEYVHRALNQPTVLMKLRTACVHVLNMAENVSAPGSLEDSELHRWAHMRVLPTGSVLRSLDLSHCRHMTGSSGAVLGTMIGREENERNRVPASQLRTLVLQGCLIGDVGVAPLFHALTLPPQRLTDLDLSFCGLTEDAAGILRRGLAGNASLMRLNLSHNRLGRQCGTAIASALEGSESLVRLDLRCNPLGIDAVLALLLALMSNMVMEWIGLAGCANPLDLGGKPADGGMRRVMNRVWSLKQHRGKAIEVDLGVAERGVATYGGTVDMDVIKKIPQRHNRQRRRSSVLQEVVWTPQASNFYSRVADSDAKSLYDTEQVCLAAFDSDIKLCKLPRIIGEPAASEAAAKLLRTAFPVLREAFRAWGLAHPGGSPFEVSFAELRSMWSDLGLERCVPESRRSSANEAVSVAFVSTNFDEGDDTSFNPADALVRYEYIEILARLAMIVYEPGTDKQQRVEAVDKFLSGNFVPVVRRTLAWHACVAHTLAAALNSVRLVGPTPWTKKRLEHFSRLRFQSRSHSDLWRPQSFRPGTSASEHTRNVSPFSGSSGGDDLLARAAEEAVQRHFDPADVTGEDEEEEGGFAKAELYSAATQLLVQVEAMDADTPPLAADTEHLLSQSVLYPDEVALPGLFRVSAAMSWSMTGDAVRRGLGQAIKALDVRQQAWYPIVTVLDALGVLSVVPWLQHVGQWRQSIDLRRPVHPTRRASPGVATPASKGGSDFASFVEKTTPIDPEDVLFVTDEAHRMGVRPGEVLAEMALRLDEGGEESVSIDRAMMEDTIRLARESGDDSLMEQLVMDMVRTVVRHMMEPPPGAADEANWIVDPHTGRRLPTGAVLPPEVPSRGELDLVSNAFRRLWLVREDTDRVFSRHKSGLVLAYEEYSGKCSVPGALRHWMSWQEWMDLVTAAGIVPTFASERVASAAYLWSAATNIDESFSATTLGDKGAMDQHTESEYLESIARLAAGGERTHLFGDASVMTVASVMHAMRLDDSRRRHHVAAIAARSQLDSRIPKSDKGPRMMNPFLEETISALEASRGAGAGDAGFEDFATGKSQPKRVERAPAAMSFMQEHMGVTEETVMVEELVHRAGEDGPTPQEAAAEYGAGLTDEQLGFLEDDPQRRALVNFLCRVDFCCQAIVRRKEGGASSLSGEGSLEQWVAICNRHEHSASKSPLLSPKPGASKPLSA
jgi:hypothetical protein